MKKFISLILTAVIMLSVFAFCFSANVFADSAVMMLSARSLKAGESLTATLKYSADAPLTALEGTLTYDNTVLKYVSGGVSEKDGTVTIKETVNSENVKSVNIIFTAAAAGKSNLTFRMEGTKGTAKGSAATGSVVSVSGEASMVGLSSLSISDCTLSPAFSSTVFDYTAVVSKNTEKVTVKANADPSFKITGAGDINLTADTNKISVSVKSNSGETKTYNITVTKSAEGTAVGDGLDIKIKGKDYRLISDFSNITVPATFSAEPIKYNNSDINIITDSKNKYEIYYLSALDGSDSDWFYLDGLGEFVRLNYIISNNTFYIVEQEEGTPKISGSWNTDNLSLGNGKVKAYKSTDSRLKDIYVLYCYVNGENGYYRYDLRENTIQRAPDFLAKEVSAKESKNILTKFSTLPKAGKLIIFLCIGEFLCIIGLIISVAVKKKKEFSLDFDEDDGKI